MIEGSFAAGYSDSYAERFPQRLSEPIALYVEGFYAQDTWKPMSGLTVTAGLRVEHNSNPLCKTNCVANFSQDFSSLPTSQATPYNSLIASGRSQAYFEQQNLAYEPRLGFSYLPGGADSRPQSAAASACLPTTSPRRSWAIWSQTCRM